MICIKSLTINQAMIQLADLEKNYKQRLHNLTSDSIATSSYVLELSGERYDCSEVFQFQKELDSLIELSTKITNLKTSISKANNETTLKVDNEERSLQECLNFLKISREQVKILENVVRFNKASKTRKVDAAGTTPYYKVVELNFDKEKIENFIQNLNSKILKLELAVNEANNNTLITIDL